MQAALPDVGYDGLVEIGTFLARRWSGRPRATVEFADRGHARTRAAEERIIVPAQGRLRGDGLQRYRQFRASVWHESMRLRLSGRILSDDHAFGFILNAIESRRVEALGLGSWPGMAAEIVFNQACRWSYRPQLGEVHGRARLAEGFYQHFVFGGTRGEAAAGQLGRIARASAAASDALVEALEKGLGAEWVEGRVPEIIRILGIDSLLTVPIAMPWSRPAMALSAAELRRALPRIARSRKGPFGRVDLREAESGGGVRAEYMALAGRQGRGGGRDGAGAGGGRGAAGGAAGGAMPSVVEPPRSDVDESAIYDAGLIAGLKRRFKDWRSGWSEAHVASGGDEFDVEAYADGQAPFLADSKRAVRARVAILLDHSSSIASAETSYKKAALALCEVLAYLRVPFSAHAFSTADRSLTCWQVKSGGQRWGSACAKRLAQIRANGSTPLAEVYARMLPLLCGGRRPDVLLTLTDGEPSDPDAVRSAIRSYKAAGIGMAAMGLGPGIVRATAIASNLRGLGYERTLAVSRLGDIPGKALSVIGGGAEARRAGPAPGLGP